MAKKKAVEFDYETRWINKYRKERDIDSAFLGSCIIIAITLVVYFLPESWNGYSAFALGAFFCTGICNAS